MEVTVTQIAQVCHDANCGYQNARGEKYRSQLWLGALRESRLTTVQGVRNVLAGKTPQECHQEWVEAYREFGWRHGEKKNEFHKTHPCMVPYEELPEHVQMKNTLFAAIVKAMAEGNEVVDDGDYA